MPSDPPSPSPHPFAARSAPSAAVVTRDAFHTAVARAEHLAGAADVASTPRRDAEQRLRQAIADLAGIETAQHGAVDEYERVLAEFRAAVRLADELLRTLEHDVRRPLAVIKGRAQLLRRHAVRETQPNAQLVRGLSEIDLAVDELVRRLGVLLPGAPTTEPPRARPRRP